MIGRALTAGEYGFDDLRSGDRVETAAQEITPALIDAFADMTGDRFTIHMTDEGARSMGFPARVAHGLLVLSVIDGLKNRAPAQFRAIASLGWDWTFSKPVIAGDLVRAIFTIRSMRATSDGQRGVLTIAVEAFNQRDEPIQKGTNRLMVWRSPDRDRVA
ncbi:MaoC family dehydratase [Paracoccus sp. (in: a-proteobacteria)]|uniref:MaoC family dehydratase n=1 Tax=Paracoccus sp. TaxID=267 RepID=UPI003A87E455